MNFDPFHPGEEEDEGTPRPPWFLPRERAPASSPSSWALLGEPWECMEEPYDGAVALYDLERDALSAGGTTRIVARFVTVRYCRLATTGAPALAELRVERAAAAGYTAVLRAPPLEARALRAIVQLARPDPPRRIVEFLHQAAGVARATRDGWGAFALQREAYRLAAARGWDGEAARAAGAIALLAQEGGGRRSPRLWRLRSRRHLRREERANAGPGP